MVAVAPALNSIWSTEPRMAPSKLRSLSPASNDRVKLCSAANWPALSPLLAAACGASVTWYWDSVIPSDSNNQAYW